MLEQHCVYTCDTRTATQMWKVYRFCIRYIRSHACMHIYVHTMLRSHSVSVIHGRVLFSARFPNTMALALVRTRTYPRTSTPTLTHSPKNYWSASDESIQCVCWRFGCGLYKNSKHTQDFNGSYKTLYSQAKHIKSALHTYTTAECHFRKCASIALSLV